MTNDTIKEGLLESKNIFYRRIKGEIGLWSATTECMKCKTLWLWGVQNNLYFVCPNCPEGKDLPRKLEVKDLDEVDDKYANLKPEDDIFDQSEVDELKVDER